MSELWFVGLGLGDERDLSRRAIDVLRSCERIFAEEYTATWEPEAFDRLSREIARPIERLDRAAVESEEPVLRALSGAVRVGFLCVGDVFAATTHLSLRLAAERAGHAWRYLPNASILTAAAGWLGLMPYRFGAPVSLPFPEPGFEPTSPIEAVARNLASGLHTLILLDLRPAERRYLLASDALGILETRDPDGLTFPPEREVAVVARIGRESARAWFGRLDRLRHGDFGPPMHAIVVPAPELHFEESEALERFRT